MGGEVFVFFLASFVAMVVGPFIGEAFWRNR